MYEGKIKLIEYQGRELRFLNQRSRNWTHLYPYGENDDSTLSSAGCGIFSIAHVVEWFTGKRMKPESLADFSVENGGRGDDGTDRPALLGAMMAHGYAGQCGFSYQLDGLRNDLEALWEHMRAGNAALCNRGREYLVIDSYSESAHEKVKNAVREVVEASSITAPVRNAEGLEVGETTQYAMYWVDANQPKDFNLLHRL